MLHLGTHLNHTSHEILRNVGTLVRYVTPAQMEEDTYKFT